MANDWFKIAISNGMKALLALRLDGTPSADTIKSTRDVWIAVLWKRYEWDQTRDVARISAAFQSLLIESTRWPSVAEFIAQLPARPVAETLPPPKMSEAERAIHLARLKKVVASITRS